MRCICKGAVTLLVKENVSLALLRKFLKTSYHARTLVTIAGVLSYRCH